MTTSRKIPGTDLGAPMRTSHTAHLPEGRPVHTIGPRRPIFGGLPGRHIPRPTLPPQGVSILGTAIEPGHVIQNTHAGSPDVVPWIPLVPNLAHRVGPYEKMPPWKYLSEASRPAYTATETFLNPEIKITYPGGSQPSGGGGTGGQGQGGTGGGGTGSGGGTGRLR